MRLEQRPLGPRAEGIEKTTGSAATSASRDPVGSFEWTRSGAGAAQAPNRFVLRSLRSDARSAVKRPERTVGLEPQADLLPCSVGRGDSCRAGYRETTCVG